MHLDLLWRDLMTSPDSVENKLFFRLITGEQHPFGNLAILLKSDDVGVVQDAVAPLLDLASPAAVLFVHGVSEPITTHLNSLGFSLIAPLPAMALRAAREIGYGVGVLQSSEAGHSVYLDLGFRDFQLVPMFLRNPD